jgi:hypothetical protein
MNAVRLQALQSWMDPLLGTVLQDYNFFKSTKITPS